MADYKTETILNGIRRDIKNLAKRVAELERQAIQKPLTESLYGGTVANMAGDDLPPEELRAR